MRAATASVALARPARPRRLRDVSGAYRFTPADPKLYAAIGAFNGYAMHGSPLSYAALLKRRAAGAWHSIYNVENGAGGNSLFPMEFDPSNHIAVDYTTANPFASVAAFNDTTNFMIVGACWDGTTTAAHVTFRWKIGAGAWGNETATSGGSNATAVGSGYHHLIGIEAGSGDDADFDMVCIGAIQSNLSQASFESLDMLSFATWQAVFTGAGAWLLGFDTIATQLDRTGNGGDETSRSVLTLQADPPGWAWGVAATPLLLPQPRPLLVMRRRLVGPPLLVPFVYAPAPAAAVDVTLVAPAALATLSAPAAALAEAAIASPAAMTLSAPAATVALVPATAPAAMTLSAPAAALTETAVAAPATMTLSGPAPTVALIVATSAATITLSAPAPALKAAAVTAPANMTLGAPAPILAEAAAASAATITLSAPVPVVTAPITVVTPPATITLSAPAAALAEALVAVPATATLSGLAPTLKLAPATAPATVTLAALPPALAQTLVAPVATATLTAPPAQLALSTPTLAATITLTAAAPQLLGLILPTRMTLTIAPAGNITVTPIAAGDVVIAARAAGDVTITPRMP